MQPSPILGPFAFAAVRILPAANIREFHTSVDRTHGFREYGEAFNSLLAIESFRFVTNLHESLLVEFIYRITGVC